MSITRRYQAGTVHYLNFDDFNPAGAEMVKGRAVVIVSPTTRRQYDIVTVVPLSTLPPKTHKRHTVRIFHDELGAGTGGSWAKCDMPATVSIRRLADYRRPRYAGQNNVPAIRISGDELQNIREAMFRALGGKEFLDRFIKKRTETPREALALRLKRRNEYALPVHQIPSRPNPRKAEAPNRPKKR